MSVTLYLIILLDGLLNWLFASFKCSRKAALYINSISCETRATISGSLRSLTLKANSVSSMWGLLAIQTSLFIILGTIKPGIWWRVLCGRRSQTTINKAIRVKVLRIMVVGRTDYSMSWAFNLNFQRNRIKNFRLRKSHRRKATFIGILSKMCKRRLLRARLLRSCLSLSMSQILKRVKEVLECLTLEIQLAKGCWWRRAVKKKSLVKSWKVPEWSNSRGWKTKKWPKAHQESSKLKRSRDFPRDKTPRRRINTILTLANQTKEVQKAARISSFKNQIPSKAASIGLNPMDNPAWSITIRYRCDNLQYPALPLLISRNL